MTPRNLCRGHTMLLAVGLLVLAGCTNVTKDQLRTIVAPTGGQLASKHLAEMASEYFSGLGYQCQADGDERFSRCLKDLRDLYIHQTHAVVQLFPGDTQDEHLLLTSRWDQGWIPGELISNHFVNPDVAEFCDWLAAQGTATCRIETA